MSTIAHRLLAAFVVAIVASLLLLVGFVLFARRVWPARHARRSRSSGAHRGGTRTTRSLTPRHAAYR